MAVKALACELPSRLGVPLSRLHVPDIAAEVVSRGIAADISGTTIWRWLSEDAIRPWRSRSWIFPRAANFEAKAGRVLDLYARTWEGKALGQRDFVISADEKTSIQARQRCHATLAPASRRDMRVEHEYDRGGALAYLAAWDVHDAKVFGRCEPTTGIEPFGRLVEQVMTTEPYASARRVFWIVDNGSSHRGRPRSQGVATRASDPPSRACLLVGPMRDLLLRRAAQGPHPERLPRPGPDPCPSDRVRGPLQRCGHTLQLEVHPPRPRQPAPKNRRPRQPPRRPPAGRMTTPAELTTATT